LNAEGVGDLLKKDISKRLQVYVDAADAFFERARLDQHYTYSFLRGIEGALKDHPDIARNTSWDGILSLAESIMKSGEAAAFDRSKRERNFHAWLADWDAVHSGLADVIRGLLSEKDGRLPLDFQRYRDRIRVVLGYLLAHPDPSPADEQLETAKHKIKSPGDADYRVGDPFTSAINSVRGRAFQVLVMFADQDGKRFKGEELVKISKDLKELYEDVLGKENTRAIMFMFGHYLPNFYFRDKEWILGLSPRIFPSEGAAKQLYTAAWEGYLANNLYGAMFFDPEIQKLYMRGLPLTDADYPEQKHFRDPDSGIAVHLSLAFMHYKEFGFDQPLFKAFWNRADPNLHAEFINFLGRSFVSGNSASANEVLKKDPESKERLRRLWDWLLEKNKDSNLFVKFGFWVNLKKEIFEPTWLAERVKSTLVKTNGVLDWDRGLAESIGQLAAAAPRDSLEIARLYLLEGAVRGDGHKRYFFLDSEWGGALETLHSNRETKPATVALINELIREGGSAFWGFKKIIETKPEA
ncbi:hypothetical protein KGO95_03265, partial [Patescibacteria group bacterium]|nr:hypothetical protein [Patescibacteria group bacterium]